MDERQDALQRRLSVTHTAADRHGDLFEDILGDRDPLLFDDHPQPLHQIGLADPTERQDLTSRNDRVGDLVPLGRRKHEHDLWRRLLKGLEEGVPRLLGEHVDLVQDDHAIA